MAEIVTLPCESYARTVRDAFEQAGGPDALAGFTHILLKPNLVNTSPFPVTTHPDFTAAAIDAIRAHTNAPITIAEGTGDKDKETDEVFAALGYDELARCKGVALLDLNHADLDEVSRPGCPVFPTMWLPKVAFTHCIVSLPVLKGHSMAAVTGTMKNMMGFAPPSHYQGGGWKKALFHRNMHGSIRDLNRYVTPHFTLMDATVGLKDYHLGGPRCRPEVGMIVAGADPLAVDRTAAGLLNIDWRDVGHLR